VITGTNYTFSSSLLKLLAVEPQPSIRLVTEQICCQ
jgi:hypothetical protein